MRFLMIVLALMFLAGQARADDDSGFVFDADYELRLNDREGGYYYTERIVNTTAGPLLDISFELHDERLGARYGCEQTNRLLLQGMIDEGVFDGQNLDEPLVGEQAFMEAYKSGLIRLLGEVRPYADDRGFKESVHQWYMRHCMGNRMEMLPQWFMMLPHEQLQMKSSGRPLKKELSSALYEKLNESRKRLAYTSGSVVLDIESELHDPVSIRLDFEQPGVLLDPFQVNMVVASFDYHEGFSRILRFADIDYSLGWDDAVINRLETPEVKATIIEARLRVVGGMYLWHEGREKEVWAVDLTGFRPSYHPLFHIQDRYHQRFATLRYYIGRQSGRILMVETLNASGSPRSVYHHASSR